MDREYEYRKSALATVSTHGDERTAVLLLCRVLARLDDIESRLASSAPSSIDTPDNRTGQM